MYLCYVVVVVELCYIAKYGKRNAFYWGCHFLVLNVSLENITNTKSEFIKAESFFQTSN